MDNGFEAAVNTDTKLASRKKVCSKVRGEVREGDRAGKTAEAGADANGTKFARVGG